MNAYREGYRDGRNRADHGDQYFGDDYFDYEAGQEQAAIDLEEDEEVCEGWAWSPGEAEEGVRG